ncbi:hypothetical protein [Catellatospora sichuanensis]|uniref:hypothetical protein n=1 Tax=Catellatospora sichuanensis TaxID=1969805 RepID=UPI001181FA88|nr:hypothetical protein [Catellatospora sichuanensis]
MTKSDDLVNDLVAGRGEGVTHLVQEVRPQPYWFVRWPIAVAVLVACGLTGHYGTGLVLELSTRLEFARADADWDRPAPPELPTSPFGAPGPVAGG